MGNDVTIAIAGQAGQFPAERDVAGDRLQPAAEHRAAGERPRTLARSSIAGFAVNTRQVAARAEPQPDARHGAEPRDRLRQGGGDRQEGLRGRPHRARCRRGNHRHRRAAPRAVARPGGPHAWRRTGRLGYGALLSRAAAVACASASSSGCNAARAARPEFRADCRLAQTHGTAQKLRQSCRKLARAAVLVPLVERPEGLQVMLTLRARRT